MAAVAVDLAGLRLDRRADRLATDSAVTAGVLAMDPFSGAGASEACKTAWNYLQENLEDVSNEPPPFDCESNFAGTCDPGTAREVTSDFGPYSVVITHPVPDDYVDSLGIRLMGDQAIEPLIDGVACQRLGVSLRRAREYAFARVLGFDTGSTVVRSVGRVAPDAGGDEVVPLLLLEPKDCAALFTSGPGKVTVGYDIPSDTPGFIVVDSDASTCGNPNPYSINNMSNNQGWIRAIPVPGTETQSAILSFALAGIPPADRDASYDPDDVDNAVSAAEIIDPSEPAASRFRLYPVPIAVAQRITRAPIDWRYDCKTGYPDYPLDLSDPGLGGIPIEDCPNTTTDSPHISLHETAYGTGAFLPGSFQSWLGAGYTCDVSSSIGPLMGDWHIECPDGLTINGVGVTVTFDGSNIVMDGGVDIRSGATLEVNRDRTDSHFIFVRAGDYGSILKRAQSSLFFDRTFVYLEQGAVDLRAGDGGLRWTAPDDDAYPFDDLALWSEAAIPHEIGGQAGNDLTGTFFTPLAEPFGLTGQADQFQFEAQFITRRLEVKGQGYVEMVPDPDKTTPIPIRAAKLIR